MNRMKKWAPAAAAALVFGGCVMIHDDRHGWRDTYDSCDYDWQCVETDQCWNVTIDYGDDVASDGLCTVACDDDGDCPGFGACADASTGPPVCYERCFDDWDCPDGFACVEGLEGLEHDPVCLPW